MASSEVSSEVNTLTGIEKNLDSLQNDLWFCYLENIIHSTKIYSNA